MENYRAAGSLLSARVAYAIVSLNVSSLFLPMAQSLGFDSSALGWLTGAYYLGFGLISLPSGFLAAKVDTRKLAVFGLLAASIAALICSAAQELFGLVILRLLVGIGLAFFYAPALSLLTKVSRRGAEGFVTGLAFAAQSLGGVIGIFGWAVLGGIIGWRLSLVVGGTIGVLMAVLILIFTAGQPSSANVKLTSLSTFLNERMVVISLVLIGLQVSYGLVLSFAVYYLENVLSLSPAAAASVASLILFAALFGSPIFGRAFDKSNKPRKLLLISGAGAAFGLLMLALQSLLLAGLGVLLVGFCSGGFAVAYDAARKSSGAMEEHRTLLYSLLVTVSLVGFFPFSLVFGWIAVTFGYFLAWIMGALLTLLLVVLGSLFLGKPPKSATSTCDSGDESSSEDSARSVWCLMCLSWSKPISPISGSDISRKIWDKDK